MPACGKTPAKSPEVILGVKDATTFFIQQTVEYARTKLPVSEAVVYLRGLLEIGGEHPKMDPVRFAFTTLSESDRQLELVQTGQMVLNLKTESQNEKDRE
jgi:hypothetical protein